MTEFDYDLFVIGGGSGGVRAARIASQHGAKVAIAEEYRYGGTCVIRGCVPKKLFVFASNFSEYFEDAKGFGWSVGKTSFDWKKLIAAKDKELDRLEAAYMRNLYKAGVEVLRTRATLQDSHTVKLEAENRTITAKYILIATGGSANVDPTLEGVEHVITSNEAFHLEELPEKIIIAGGGYIGVEFAFIFNGLGVDTTLIYRRDKVLRGFDIDLRDCVQDEMRKKGIKLVLEDTFTKIENRGKTLIGHTKKGEKLEAGQIMFAIGRSPNTQNLGLASAGIEIISNGAIKVDEYSKTNIDNIYAVGDVTDRMNLTPVAIREGHAFADTVFGGMDKKMDYSCIATAVFSHPELGTVGMTEEEARQTYKNIDIYKTSFRPMRLVLTERDEKMMMKLIVDADTDKVLGIHICGREAGEMAQLMGVSMKMGVTKADLDRTVAVHPTAGEELVTMREPVERIRG
jgi:glutathione reductase (NADPH)